MRKIGVCFSGRATDSHGGHVGINRRVRPPVFSDLAKATRLPSVVVQAAEPGRGGVARAMETKRNTHVWAVLLAGGDGTRLRNLTVRIAGDDRPKQYCPIIGAESLLSQTRARLDPLFSGDRQVFVVSRAHERYYSKELADARESLVIAQPQTGALRSESLLRSFRSCRQILTRSWGSFPAIITTPMTSRSGRLSDRRQRARNSSAGHSLSSGRRLSTQKPNTAGSNRGLLYWKHKLSRCVESIDFGKSQRYLRRERYCKAVASGIPSSLSAARLLFSSWFVRKFPMLFFRWRARWPITIWRPPTHSCPSSTFRATSWPIRRKDFWCFAILARDGQTLVALTECSACLPDPSISRLGFVKQMDLRHKSTR